MATSEHSHTTANAFTKGVYRDVYTAIDSTQSSVSKAGKIVMITGASRGIGRNGIAWAFATAGAKAIIITARKVTTLNETEALIKKANPAVEILPLALEIANEDSVIAAFDVVKQKYGHVDILVKNAGIFGTAGINISTTSADETARWWSDFDVNIRGTMLVAKHFLQLVGTERRATLIHMTSRLGFMVVPSLSADSIAKLADLQLAAFTAAENANVTAIAFHPGIIHTDIMDGAPQFAYFAKDTPRLAGAAVNWLASEQAKFMDGRYVSANWDVEELLARKEEIIEKNLLTLALNGLTGQTAEVRG